MVVWGIWKPVKLEIESILVTLYMIDICWGQEVLYSMIPWTYFLWPRGDLVISQKLLQIKRHQAQNVQWHGTGKTRILGTCMSYVACSSLSLKLIALLVVKVSLTQWSENCSFGVGHVYNSFKPFVGCAVDMALSEKAVDNLCFRLKALGAPKAHSEL